MAVSRRQVVDRHIAALNHGTLEEVLQTFAPDATFRSDQGTASGHREIGQLFSRTLVGGERPTTVLRSAEEEGDEVTCLLTRRFAIRDHDRRIAASHEVDVRATFTVRHGLIVDVRVHPAI